MMTVKMMLVLLALATPGFGQVLVKEPAEETVMISEHAPGLRLVCYVNDTSSNAATDGEGKTDEGPKIKWFHSNSTSATGQEVAIDDKYIKVNSKGHSVLLMSELDAAHGTVMCKMEDMNLQKSWKVAKHFRVKALEKSMTVVGEDDLELFCKLRPNADNDGKLKFTWYKIEEGQADTEGVLLKNSTATSEEFDPHIRIKNFGTHSALKIEDVTTADRAIYRCVATLTKRSPAKSLNSTTETLIRVKDKYSALYPFLGIVAEVVVLAVVIFLCERRKSSGEDEDDDEDYDGAGGGGATGNGNSNLRQRRH